MPHMVMVHKKDPKDVILDKIGDISDVQVKFRNVLLAIYERPEKTESGIFLTDKTTDEDKYQGKAHLVLAMGPDAFADADGAFDEINGVDEGDWVVIRASDGWAVNIN